MSWWRSHRRLWVGWAAVIVILLLWRPGAERFRARLEQSLGSALGHKVEIGSVSLQILPRPGFNLSQLSVRDDPQFSLEPILRADEVSATLHPSSLWRWRIEIATLSFKEASLNLVRRPDGRWNLEPLLERAAHAPAAPTAKVTAEERRRFPYIEVSHGRVNLKLGAEKTPYALTDADLALWLESDEEWGLRLKGQPVRTDMRLSDTGILRASATWRRADALRQTPLQLTAAYDGAQLGQLTKLVYGADKGWRGTVSLSASLNGSAEDLQIQSEATVQNFRRYDLVTAPRLRLAATCSARLNGSARQLSEILCSSPAEDGSLLLRGKTGLVRPAAYDLNLNAAKFPAERLVEVLRGIKQALPEDLSATGTVNADISFVGDGMGDAKWSGGGNTDHLVLQSAALQTKGGEAAIAFGAVPFHAISNRGRARDSDSKTGPRPGNTNRTNGAPSFENAIEIGPMKVDLGDEPAASLRARLSPKGYNASFSGETSIERLLQVARSAGVTAVHPALEGDCKFEWQANGTWGGFTAPQASGSIHLSDVRAEFPGLNAPVAIASADVNLTPDVLRVDRLSATAGGMHWTGSIVRPRLCPGPGTCPTQVDLHADEVSTEKLNLLLNPNIRKQPWYRILTGSPEQFASALRTLSVQGTLKVDHFAAGDLSIEAGAAQVKLEEGRLQLTEFRGTVLGGRHMGDWRADFTKPTPAYAFTGTLENVSLPQLGKAMHTGWITGTARGSYDLTLTGWNEAELRATARGSLTMFAHDGTFARFGPSGGPLKFYRADATLTAGQSLAVVSEGKLENAQGIYEIGGVASFGHKIDLRFQREEGHGFAVSGTLEEPHFANLGAEEAAKAEVRKPVVPDRDR